MDERRERQIDRWTKSHTDTKQEGTNAHRQVSQYLVPIPIILPPTLWTFSKQLFLSFGSFASESVNPKPGREEPDEGHGGAPREGSLSSIFLCSVQALFPVPLVERQLLPPDRSMHSPIVKSALTFPV